MILGILIGAVAAIVSVLPGLVSLGAEVQIGSLIGLIFIIIANGLVWILVFAGFGINRVNLAWALKND